MLYKSVFLVTCLVAGSLSASRRGPREIIYERSRPACEEEFREVIRNRQSKIIVFKRPKGIEYRMIPSYSSASQSSEKVDFDEKMNAYKNKQLVPWSSICSSKNQWILFKFKIQQESFKQSMAQEEMPLELSYRSEEEYSEEYWKWARRESYKTSFINVDNKERDCLASQQKEIGGVPEFHEEMPLWNNYKSYEENSENYWKWARRESYHETFFFKKEDSEETKQKEEFIIPQDIKNILQDNYIWIGQWAYRDNQNHTYWKSYSYALPLLKKRDGEETANKGEISQKQYERELNHVHNILLEYYGQTEYHTKNDVKLAHDNNKKIRIIAPRIIADFPSSKKKKKREKYYYDWAG